MGYKYRDTKAISIDPVTETGNIVTFENPDDVTGITSLIADIEPKQDGTPWVSPDNTAPYLLRQSPQYGNEYNNEYDTLIGGSIAWNQLFSARMATATMNGVTVTNNNDGSFTLQGTATADSSFRLNQSTVGGADHLDTYYAGHKYLILGNDSVRLTIMRVSTWNIFASIYGVGIVTSNQTLDNCFVYMPVGTGVALDGKITPQIIDLTAAFGTEIADYVYSLEQSTAGSGIAWLKSYGFLTKDYYADDSGSLVSVKTSEHRTTGFNQWDEEYLPGSYNAQGEYVSTSAGQLCTKNRIKIFPNTDYYFKFPSTGNNICYYDANGDFITRVSNLTPNAVFRTHGNAYYANLSLGTNYGAVYNHDICINISKTTGTPKNGDYVAYESHSYPLGNDDLRGLFKLSNGNLYADGDVKTSDGQIARKYDIVDLGMLTYVKASYDSDRYYFNTSGISSLIRKPNANNEVANWFICAKGYDASSSNDSHRNSHCLAVQTGGNLIIHDSAYYSLDATAFKTAMSGVYLVYEKESASTEQADPFASPQIVSPLGTEEYIDERSVPVPVGHRTVYKNIAPISGYSEINIYVSPTEDAEDATVYSVDLNGTRYGKQMNVTTGQLEVCPYYASYNGETLTGEWISDRDVYAPGTTPSIGAQVVNIGGTLTTEQLLPMDIKTLVGTNNVWSDSGDITLTYAVDPSLYITLPKEAVSMDGRYLERMIDGYTTLYVKGRESLGIELNTYSVGTADGERVKGSRYPSRTLTIGFQLLCEDEVEFRAKFNQLNNLLSIGRADFIFADEPTMFFTGTPVMDATIEPGKNNVTGEWKLYCDYPFKRSVEPTVLSSTDSGVLVGDHEATFVFDYKGVMPAKPILRCEFDSTKSGGDYSEDGDCGFVAFLNQDESIIQLGNPEIIDLDSINKSATLINSEFSSLANWTVDGMTAGNIVDPYWNNGEGQTQSYAKGIGTLSRTTTGAIDFDFSIVHRLCVNASSQTGAFKVDLTNDGDTIVGFAIEKTGNGTSATVSYIVNGIVVGTDNIDISYNNANFGFCSRTEYFVVTDINGEETILTKDNYHRKMFGFYDNFFGFGGFRHGSQIRRVRREYDYSQSNLNSRISRNGNAVTFQIGNLAKRTFKNNDIENVPCYDVKFETTGNFDTNAIRSCSFIRKTGVAFAKIPNVFTAGDIVEADCNSANVFMYRNGSLVGHLEPQYGALGNNWEDFDIKVGHNIIRAVWSEWSNPAYKPVIKIIFNEVYI